METAGKDVLYTIAMNLELPELLKWCGSGDKIYKDVCNNDDLWRNRLLRDYRDYQKFNSENFSINSLSLKEAYVFLYQLTWIKKLLNTNESELPHGHTLYRLFIESSSQSYIRVDENF